MSSIKLSDGTNIETKEGDRYEVNGYHYFEIDSPSGSRETILARPGDVIQVGKPDLAREIIQLPAGGMFHNQT